MSRMLGNFMAMALLMGGGAPHYGTPRTRVSKRESLPDGFKKWYFNQKTGELVDPHTPTEENKHIKLYTVTSRSEEKAREQYEKAKKKNKW